ncbi:unnamed protein product [Sphagnum jensenii]|uniref:Uncharacterized protein n=1 Tax=Sphagnum jensenii TaxID=128206 RepID=A0ABP0VT91_9BRYO
MEDEEEETRMDERASGDNTGVVCRGHRVNRRTRRLQRLLTRKLSPHMQQQQQVDRIAAVAKIIAEP